MKRRAKLTQWRLESFVNTRRPVRGGNYQGQLDNLLFAEEGAQRLEIDIPDILRARRQQVRVAQKCLFGRFKQIRAVRTARFLQTADLPVRYPSPLTRSGVRSSSIFAAVQDGHPEKR